MKRRKQKSVYVIGDNGEITNTNPVLSPKTRDLLSAINMVSELKQMSETLNSMGIDDECIMEDDIDESQSEEEGTNEPGEESETEPESESICDQV